MLRQGVRNRYVIKFPRTYLLQCLFSHTSQKAQLRAPLSPLQAAWTGFDPYLREWLILAKAYANHPWSVTEPEAVGVPGWQAGAKALCVYSQSPQASKPVRRAPTWLITALVEWNALLTILASGVWQTLCQSQCPC